MTKTEAPAVLITEFEVTDGGTLLMANYAEAQTRADFYEDVSDFWSRSPGDLAEAMDECQPLAWAVCRIYSDFRDELMADLQDVQDAGRGNKRRLAALKARLQALPEEPEDGAAGWLLGLTSKEFEDRVVPAIAEWFGEPPDWNFEDDYLPDSGTAQGAALQFFRDMATEDLEVLGVDIVEGEHPSSTYHAAELRGKIETANAAAASNGIAVRFLRQGRTDGPTRRPCPEVDRIESKTGIAEPARTHSIEALRGILAELPCHGPFRERHTLPSGEEVIHMCSQATGLAALHCLHRYRARFGEPPSWLAICHPEHRRRLCEWALENQVPLPDQTPQD